MSKRRRTIDEKIREYGRTGRVEIPWDHHPEEIKELIRRCRHVPLMKDCFTNCGKVAAEAAMRGGLDDRLVYCEGWATGGIIPAQHAWLKLDGVIIELTLEDECTEYIGDHFELSPHGVVAMAIRHETWGPWHNLWSVGPYAEAMRQVLAGTKGEE